MERDHRGERGDEPGDLVGERDRREQWTAVGLTVDRSKAAHRFGDRGEPGTRRVRAVLAESGDAGDHEPRVAGEEHVRAESEALERAGTKVLHQHVGLVAEPQHHREIVGVLEVERDRPLATPEELPPQGDAIPGVAPAERTGGVAAVGTLDLDDVGAKVGEVSRARGPRHHRRDVDDPQVGEGSRHPKTEKPSGSERRPPSALISTSGSTDTSMRSIVNATGVERTVAGVPIASVRSSECTVSSTIRVGR